MKPRSSMSAFIAILLFIFACSSPDDFGSQLTINKTGKKTTTKKQSTKENDADATIAKKVGSNEKTSDVVPDREELVESESKEMSQANDQTEVELPPTTGDTEISEAETEACAKGIGRDVKKVVILGNSKRSNLKATDVVAIYVSGNDAALNVTVGEVAGICVFSLGNEAKATIQISGNVGGMYVSSVGNESVFDLLIGDTGKLDHLLIDSLGNRPVANIEGSGEFDCKNVKTGNVAGLVPEIFCDGVQVPIAIE